MAIDCYPALTSTFLSTPVPFFKHSPPLSSDPMFAAVRSTVSLVGILRIFSTPTPNIQHHSFSMLRSFSFHIHIESIVVPGNELQLSQNLQPKSKWKCDEQLLLFLRFGTTKVILPILLRIAHIFPRRGQRIQQFPPLYFDFFS